MLCDQVVFGVNNARIQKTLRSESTLTLESALTKAQAMETAEKNAEEILAPTVAVDDGTLHQLHQWPTLEESKKSRLMLQM